MLVASRVLYAICFIALLLVVSGEVHRLRAGAGFRKPLPAALYVLSVGINEYPRDSSIPHLRFAVADAQGVASAFSTKEVGKVFDKVEVSTLSDSAAILGGVRSALEHLISASHPEDLVFCYFAGMGQTTSSPLTESGYNFVLFDSSKGSNTLTARELSALLLSIPARRQIIILDSVQSSLAFEALHQALNSDSIFTLRDAGRRFAPFGVEGASNETPDLGHGLLTYALIEAMKGAADTNHDGVITEAELEGYMMSRIQDLTYQHQGIEEQLLSYSDLRGLCLFARDVTPACDRLYGYDPWTESTAKMRGPQPEEPTLPEQSESRGTDYALILAGDTYDRWPKLDNPIYDAQILHVNSSKTLAIRDKTSFMRRIRPSEPFMTCWPIFSGAPLKRMIVSSSTLRGMAT
jgi:hypothetical protein